MNLNPPSIVDPLASYVPRFWPPAPMLILNSWALQPLDKKSVQWRVKDIRPRLVREDRDGTWTKGVHAYFAEDLGYVFMDPFSDTELRLYLGVMLEAWFFHFSVRGTGLCIERNSLIRALCELNTAVATEEARLWEDFAELHVRHCANPVLAEVLFENLQANVERLPAGARPSAGLRNELAAFLLGFVNYLDACVREIRIQEQGLEPDDRN